MAPPFYYVLESEEVRRFDYFIARLPTHGPYSDDMLNQAESSETVLKNTFASHHMFSPTCSHKQAVQTVLCLV